MTIAPKPRLATVLSLVLVSVGLEPLRHALLLIVFCLASDLVFLKLRGIRLFFPWAAIATGLILALVLSFKTPWFVSLAAAALAIFSKNFLRLKRRHLFNPAAFGLWVVSFYDGNVSWWVDGVNPFLKLFLFLGLVPLLWQLRKIGLPLLFIFWGAVGRGLANLPLWPPIFVFFPLVMLTEPMTSPRTIKNQFFYALFVFLGANFLARMPLSFGEPYLAALLAGNLWTRFYDHRT